jgi:hypothetical protein
MSSNVLSCLIRQQYGPLEPLAVTIQWNRFTESVVGPSAKQYFDILNKYLPREAWEEIWKLPWS